MIHARSSKECILSSYRSPKQETLCHPEIRLMPPSIAAISVVPRHSALVRVTHWINTLSFFALVISGIAILLAHPRLYWGETGTLGTPSLLDLPLPFMLTGQSGWGRSLHFLAAWICIVNGLLYAVVGLATQHFRKQESTTGSSG